MAGLIASVRSAPAYSIEPAEPHLPPQAVANSAGPDSVCLLHLISDLVNEADRSRGLPAEVWSIHVNHNLQPANAEMATRAYKIANDLGALSHIISIPWGHYPFPSRPDGGEPLEEIARAARQNRLLHTMVRADIPCIAFGHHADDQVETAIMRIMKGSGDLGAAGMRPIRRWGMGNEGLDAAGMQGMDRWVVRPLLSVTKVSQVGNIRGVYRHLYDRKSRILATCAAHNLEYVTDKTNFQPSLTLRNHVRHYLSERHHNKVG